MPIIVSEHIEERGKGDAKRHRDKQREAVKKGLSGIIAEESIITGKKGRIVKVPIKSLDIPHFKQGRDGTGSVGVGQGKGKVGDVLGRRPGKEKKPGEAGTEPGVDYVDAEFTIEELIELALEDMGLPNLEQKNVREIEVQLGFKIRGTQHTGPHVLLNRKKTAQNGIKRFWSFLRALQAETGKDELLCYAALKKSAGRLDEALTMLKTKEIEITEKEIVAFPILHAEDTRYHKIEENTAKESQAVMIAIMDVSGSMSDTKKYYARIMIFWLVNFLRQVYKSVIIRFIAHDTQARIVNEEDFFTIGESGGTFCYAGYEAAHSLIDAEYPTKAWNVYVWHFSDGDDAEPERSAEEVRKLFDKGINMFGYGEIRPDEENNDMPNLVRAFDKLFNLEDKDETEGLKILVSAEETYPFLGVVLSKKEDILPALRAFLKRDRWSS